MDAPDKAVAGERDITLMIADISGYTAFLHSQRATLAHAQVILNELMQAVLDEVQLPVQIAKFEGDAVLCYAEHEPGGASPVTGPLLMRFVEAFRRRRDVLVSSSLCACEACGSIAHLRLKVVVHTGRALFYRIHGSEELAGPDVILVHRLLKNAVPSHEYLLLSDAAWHHLIPEGERGDRWRQGRERYDGAAPITTRFVMLEDSVEVTRVPYLTRLGHEFVKAGKSLPYRLGLRPFTLKAAPK
jgi:class 3 adenylate cyclase